MTEQEINDVEDEESTLTEFDGDDEVVEDK